MLNSSITDPRKQKTNKKSLNKSTTSTSTRKKRPNSSIKKNKPKEHNGSIAQTFANDNKKKTSKGLTKKKIEDIKAPDLVLKVSYKGKKLSIPLTNIEN